MRRASGRRGQPPVRPFQRLAVDVLLEQPLLHHQPEVRPRPPPRRVGRLVDDVAQVVQPPGQRRAVRGEPGLAALAALPGAGGEAEDLDLDLAALQRARQHVGRDRRDRDRPAAHRAGVVEQQRDHGVAEVGVALALEARAASSGSPPPAPAGRRRACPPRGRSPRRGSAAPAAAAAAGWRAAPPRPSAARAAGRGRRAAARARPGRRGPRRRSPRRSGW